MTLAVLLYIYDYIIGNKNYIIMSRKTLPLEERKVKIGISLDRKLNDILENKIYNKSKYIEELIRKDLKKKYGTTGN